MRSICIYVLNYNFLILGKNRDFTMVFFFEINDKKYNKSPCYYLIYNKKNPLILYHTSAKESSHFGVDNRSSASPSPLRFLHVCTIPFSKRYEIPIKRRRRYPNGFKIL